MTSSPRLEENDLTDRDFDTVVIAGSDMYGRLTGKRIPLRRWKTTADEGLHVCTSVYAWDFAQDLGALKVEYAGDHTGWHDFRMVPDVNTLRRAAWLDRTAIVLADSVEVGGAFVPIAPRSILRSAVHRVEIAGRRAAVATELEFHLYKGTPAELRARSYRDLAPTTDVHSDYNIIEGDLYEPFFTSLCSILEASGVPVEVAQVEYGLGQWEINLEYADPLEMADRHALFKHVVRAVAARNGMTATFMPRPLTDGLGSSCHIHVSMRDSDGVALFHDPNADRMASETLLHAVGGLLSNAPAHMLLYAPTVNSMRRLLTRDFAGNGLTWGFDNRTTTCRLLTGSTSSARVEFRLPGSDANPYLAVAAVLGSIQAGIDNQEDPGPALTGNGYVDTQPSALPRTLGEAAAAFRGSGGARTWFGDLVVDHYATVADNEWNTFLTAVTDWDRDRYLDSI